MDTARYIIALGLTLLVPALSVSWLIIHPFIRLWRRLGPGRTWGLLGVVLGLVAAGLASVRGRLLAAEYGTSYPLAALGILVLAAAARLRVLIRRQAATRCLIGLPELAPDRYPTRLIREGLYARIRHPRYVQLGLAIVGYALVANYLAGYVMVALWIPMMWIIAVLEERELRERFGAAYEEYCRTVPRFVPRLGRR